MGVVKNRIESYFEAKLELELQRIKFEDEMLRAANAGEIEMDGTPNSSRYDRQRRQYISTNHISMERSQKEKLMASQLAINLSIALVSDDRLIIDCCAGEHIEDLVAEILDRALRETRKEHQLNSQVELQNVSSVTSH